MLKVSTFRAQPFNACVNNSYGPLLIIRPKDAPPQWIDALENWCRNAPEKERPNRLEAAKHVLQQYADPQSRTLDLSRMRLTSLPLGLFHLVNLQELNVSQNLGLRALPEDLGKCAALHSIDASSCSLNEWPACLSELPSLKTLLLDDNPDLRVFSDQIRQCRTLENLSMEATRPRGFKYPPLRLLPLGEARGRALVRMAPSSPWPPHGNSRTRSVSPPAHAAAPSVASLLGFRKAHQLDKDFGSLQWPRGEPGFPSIKSWEFDVTGALLMLNDRIFVSNEEPHLVNLAALLDLEKLKTGKKKYMWAVGKLGRLIIAEEMEITVNTSNGEKQKYIGHPALVGGGRARISGELRFKTDPHHPSSGKFYINNASGRFSTFTDRNEAQLKNVAALFRKANLAVEIEYNTELQTVKPPRPVSGLQPPIRMTRQFFQKKTVAPNVLRPHRF